MTNETTVEAIEKLQNMTDEQQTTKLSVWVIFDERHRPVARCHALSQAEAITAFCYPALREEAYFVHGGWTCERDQAPHQPVIKPNGYLCEACGAPATRTTSDDVPLCEEDYWAAVHSYFPPIARRCE